MSKEAWADAGVEPALWDLLADPIVQCLMRADRITRRDVLRASTPFIDRPAPTPDEVA